MIYLHWNLRRPQYFGAITMYFSPFLRQILSAKNQTFFLLFFINNSLEPILSSLNQWRQYRNMVLINRIFRVFSEYFLHFICTNFFSGKGVPPPPDMSLRKVERKNLSGRATMAVDGA